MTTSQNQTADDFFILDLFLSEVSTHGRILLDGLLGIRKAPDSGVGVDTLINTIKPIYGGALIVEADDIADIATAIKECLLSCQAKTNQLLPGPADSLIKAAELMLEMTEQESHNLKNWLEQKHDHIHLIIDNILEKSATTDDKPLENNPPLQDVGDSNIAGTIPGNEAKQQATITADDTMLDMFMEEVKTHTEMLNNGLLNLENNPSDSVQLEALMRSAHSLKGGARVLGLNMGVDCAHVMEDCFVAAQNGRITLESEDIDVLLKGVDMLQSISEAALDRDKNRLDGLWDENDRLTVSIRAISTGSTSSVPVAQKEYPEKAQKRVGTPAIQEEETDSYASMVPESSAGDTQFSDTGELLPQTKTKEATRAIRVSAEKIERLMGLAGEVVVGASWLTPFSESLHSLKRNQRELYDSLSRLQEIFRGANQDDEVKEIIEQAREKNKEIRQNLAERMNHLEKFTGSYATLSDSIYHEIISVRMRPFADGVQKFPRLVRDLSRQLDKKIQLDILGKKTEVDRDILEKLDAPLTHLIQNAVDHGIESYDERLAARKPESGRIVLQASHLSGMLMVTISDDGRGIYLENLRKKIVQKKMANEQMVEKMNEYELLDFLFLPGFTTKGDVTQISGRGVGLDVVHSMVREVGGNIRAETTPGKGLTFIMELPLTLSVIRTFLVEISDELYAFPMARIDRCLILKRQDIEIVEDREYFQFDGSNIALINVHDVLDLTKSPNNSDEILVLVISDRIHAYGLVVDKFIGETDLVQRPLDSRLGKVPNVDSAAIILDGSPVLIIDVEDMVCSIDKLLDVHSLKKIRAIDDGVKDGKKRILVVDDSITVREMERKLLTSTGFAVDVAVDGVDAWTIVRSNHFDLIITDIDMPRMNGFELVTNIKRNEELRDIPVIIMSYKDREEDRIQGFEAGANRYLTKSSFDDDTFLDAVIDLLIEP